MKNHLNICPKCSAHIRIARYHCPSCDTSVNGDFSGCSFCLLDDEDRLFALVFIQTEGNMKDVERLMGISYPTVKARLAKLNNTLAGETLPPPSQEGLGRVAQPAGPSPAERARILDSLASGEITAQRASRLLRGDKVDPADDSPGPGESKT